MSPFSEQRPKAVEEGNGALNCFSFISFSLYPSFPPPVEHVGEHELFLHRRRCTGLPLNSAMALFINSREASRITSEINLLNRTVALKLQRSAFSDQICVEIFSKAKRDTST